ncbi:conjugative transposon protein TraM [Segetibacter sp. 3557_3]|uniref:conjugative transposon protein TraM n=1 Tax=Segetibacter sp. 3557_3 TaxID=2547429 RepID=UPI001058B7F1|nr:conjugative transposon protein TraM [Segetibacter sp. 3557_3]TDH18158.1 conjugative transposon protein TraM [Segetibacter sp. 3557_3]
MEKKTPSIRFLKKRRFLMVLPVLVIPFVTLLFWSLGGGKGSEVAGQDTGSKGLNLSLPSARIVDDRRLDKLGFYEQAESESAKLSELKKTDPYYRNGIDNGTAPGMGFDTKTTTSLSSLSGANDSNEARVYRKLAELNSHLNPTTARERGWQTGNDFNASNSADSRDVDRLEAIMRSAREESAEDHEMQQLNVALDKIMDIQHPERIKERSKIGEEPEERFHTASANQQRITISLLEPRGKVPMMRQSVAVFHGLTDTLESNAISGSGILAAIYSDQTVVNGSVIKLKLLEELNLGDILIPAGGFVFGNVQVNDQRLNVNISSIKHGNSVYPVKLTLYDLDGLEGLHIPGAIGRDVAKESSANALQTIELSTMTPSVAGQATNAGISAVRSLLARKAKLIKVTVRNGYQVILQDNSKH